MKLSIILLACVSVLFLFLPTTADAGAKTRYNSGHYGYNSSYRSNNYCNVIPFGLSPHWRYNHSYHRSSRPYVQSREVVVIRNDRRSRSQRPNRHFLHREKALLKKIKKLEEENNTLLKKIKSLEEANNKLLKEILTLKKAQLPAAPKLN
tara:strand:- start:478 stop:927 length:450 start_codon:yes stop_codon:yes gene_type:complete